MTAARGSGQFAASAELAAFSLSAHPYLPSSSLKTDDEGCKRNSDVCHVNDGSSMKPTCPVYSELIS